MLMEHGSHEQLKVWSIIQHLLITVLLVFSQHFRLPCFWFQVMVNFLMKNFLYCLVVVPKRLLPVWYRTLLLFWFYLSDLPWEWLFCGNCCCRRKAGFKLWQTTLLQKCLKITRETELCWKSEKSQATLLTFIINLIMKSDSEVSAEHHFLCTLWENKLKCFTRACSCAYYLYIW